MNGPLPDDVATLAEWLVSFDSTSGRETVLMAALADSLTARGWRVTRIPVDADRFAVIATSGDGSPVTLSTHLDTVPPYIPPRREQDVLRGRGSCDAKGIAAAMICASERIRSAGAHAAERWLNSTGFRSRALVNGEPTQSKLALGTKGAMRLTVRTEGEAAHSAYPQLGRSATKALVELLAGLDSLELPHDDLLGATTINIGKLAGGVADNVVAPSAEARLMARLVSDGDEVWRVLEQWARGKAHIQRGIEVPPMRLATLPGFNTDVVAFATDIPAMPSWGTPYLFGPGSIHVAHRDDEHVSLDELRLAVDAYERIVRLIP